MHRIFKLIIAVETSKETKAWNIFLGSNFLMLMQFPQKKKVPESPVTKYAL